MTHTFEIDPYGHEDDAGDRRCPACHDTECCGAGPDIAEAVAAERRAERARAAAWHRSQMALYRRRAEESTGSIAITRYLAIAGTHEDAVTSLERGDHET